MSHPSEEFTHEYLTMLGREYVKRIDSEIIFQGTASEPANERILKLEARVEELERRLTYAEFLAGLTSRVDVVVCPEDTPVDLIASRLGFRKVGR